MVPDDPVNVGVLSSSASTSVTTVVFFVVGRTTDVGVPAVPAVTEPSTQLKVNVSFITLAVNVGNVTEVGTFAVPGVTEPAASTSLIVTVVGVTSTFGLLTVPEGVNDPEAESL